MTTQTAETAHPSRTPPLEGVTVLDLTIARAGPTCVRHLADWGATIIRIDPPDTGMEDIAGPWDGADFQNMHRNKKSIRLNLKSPEGHDAFLRLVANADVMVENMRVDVKHRLNISYDDLRAVNPRIVYGSISGYGQTGPYSKYAGVDQIAQGMGGLMSVTGQPGEGPLRVGIPIADLTAGNLLAFAVALALFQRERTGEGQWVSTSLLEAQVFMMDFQAARWLLDGVVPEQAGNHHPIGIPTGMFMASDKAINIAASSGKQWLKFCEIIGRQDWLSVPQWQTQAGRSADRAVINAEIDKVIGAQPSDHWIEVFLAAGIPCGPVNTIDQVFDDPQVRHLGMAAPIRHPRHGDQRLVSSPINLHGTGRAIRSATPGAGQHTAEVLETVGFSAEEVSSFRARGVI